MIFQNKHCLIHVFNCFLGHRHREHWEIFIPELVNQNFEIFDL